MSAPIIRDVLEIIPFEANQFEAEIDTLRRIKTYDEYTYLHCLNVARLSVNLGKKLGLSERSLLDLAWAALLHDIGKLNVPLEILNKVKKFSADELAVMQSHPLEALTAFAKTQTVTLERLRRLSAAFEHHQRYDLKGYPRVSRKLQLHPYSRIVAIADTFDAMTTDRIYQRRVLPDVALKILAQGFGTIFDPVALQAFITSMGAYPVGTLVRLSDQRLAVVIGYYGDSALDRPQIVVMQKETEGPINLMDAPHQNIRILKSEFPEDHSIKISEILDKHLGSKR